MRFFSHTSINWKNYWVKLPFLLDALFCVVSVFFVLIHHLVLRLLLSCLLVFGSKTPTLKNVIWCYVVQKPLELMFTRASLPTFAKLLEKFTPLSVRNIGSVLTSLHSWVTNWAIILRSLLRRIVINTILFARWIVF